MASSLSQQLGNFGLKLNTKKLQNGNQSDLC